MAKQLWTGTAKETGLTTYATYENAVKKAEKEIGDRNVRYVICATSDGRFYPVALGFDAVDAGLHFRMAVTN